MPMQDLQEEADEAQALTEPWVPALSGEDGLLEGPRRMVEAGGACALHAWGCAAPTARRTLSAHLYPHMHACMHAVHRADSDLDVGSYYFW